MITLHWENVKDATPRDGYLGEAPRNIYRARIFGGWLVSERRQAQTGPSLAFVPDPKHEWN